MAVADGVWVGVGVGNMQPLVHKYDPPQPLPVPPAAMHAAAPVVQVVGTEVAVPSLRTGLPVQEEESVA